jgi:hypothetical protein
VSAAGTISRKARRGARSDALRRVARVGFVARGVVYGVIGALSLQIAWGRGAGREQEASKDGALRLLAERSIGRGLLALLAIGLVGYIAWRASQVVWPDGGPDDDAKADLAHRLGSAAKALVYGAFLWSTVRVVVAGPSGSQRSGDARQQAMTARLLDLPGGRGLAVIAGLAVLAGAGWSGYRGLAQRFEDRLDTSAMGRATGWAVDVAGTVGLAARGLVYGLAGWLLVKAALDYDPDKALGLDGTLRTMAHQPYGKVLLTVTALGLLLFALYSFAEARYREI